jgi:cbb3-type cytochrome oxidase cytochrome c subunit
MNHGPLVFLAAFFALAASWFGFVLTPQIQIGRQPQATNTVNTAELYPQARPGLARQGLEVYRAEGCAACHTEQVGQAETVCDVMLTDAGTNQAALLTALVKAGLGKSNPGQFLSGLPKSVLQGVDLTQADSLVTALKSAGAKAVVRVVPVGADIARGWGKRRTVAQDYLYDDTVMLGSLRVGPDLANAGVRLPDANWQLRHLYAPRSEVKGSVMPPYRYLFEQRTMGRQPSPEALPLPPEWAPPPGFEIVPKPEAKALVAYLLSLRAETPLFEAPLTVASAPASPAAADSPAK